MKFMMILVLAGLVGVVAGCNQSRETAETETAVTASTAGAQYIAITEPAGAVPVGEARQNVKNDEEVTLVGTIGGSQEPFVDGLAAFTIVDPKVPYCAPDEGCPTPWDYCCTMDQVKDNIATVKVLNEDGSPVAADARSLLNVKELSTVVVEGKAKRDDSGNLVVLARKIFVRPVN